MNFKYTILTLTLLTLMGMVTSYQNCGANKMPIAKKQNKSEINSAPNTSQNIRRRSTTTEANKENNNNNNQVKSDVIVQHDGFADVGSALKTIKSVNTSAITLGVDNKKHPLYGLEVIIPKVDGESPIQIEVSHAYVKEIETPAGSSEACTPLINIQIPNSMAHERITILKTPIIVKVPLNKLCQSKDYIGFYLYMPNDKSLIPASVINRSDTTITYILTQLPKKSSISTSQQESDDFIFAGIALTAKNFDPLRQEMIATGFGIAEPSNSNALHIPDMGSYLTPVGNSLGMVNLAKYMFKNGINPLFTKDKLNAPNVANWFLNNVSMEAAARAEMTYKKDSHLWKKIAELNINELKNNNDYHTGRVIARAVIDQIYTTRSPVTLQIFTESNESKSVLVFAAKVIGDTMEFSIYDPIFPHTPKQIVFDAEKGFLPYVSSKLKGQPSQIYKKFIIYNDLDTDKMKSIVDSAFDGFKDNSLFPTITIDSITQKESSKEIQFDDQKKKEYLVDEGLLVVKGQISEYPSSGEFSYHYFLQVKVDKWITSSLEIDSKGNRSFSFELPLKEGANEISILLGDEPKITEIDESPFDLITKWGGSKTISLFNNGLSYEQMQQANEDAEEEESNTSTNIENPNQIKVNFAGDINSGNPITMAESNINFSDLNDIETYTLNASSPTLAVEDCVIHNYFIEMELSKTNPADNAIDSLVNGQIYTLSAEKNPLLKFNLTSICMEENSAGVLVVKYRKNYTLPKDAGYKVNEQLGDLILNYHNSKCGDNVKGKISNLTLILKGPEYPSEPTPLQDQSLKKIEVDLDFDAMVTRIRSNICKK